MSGFRDTLYYDSSTRRYRNVRSAYTLGLTCAPRTTQRTQHARNNEKIRPLTSSRRDRRAPVRIRARARGSCTAFSQTQKRVVWQHTTLRHDREEIGRGAFAVRTDSRPPVTGTPPPFSHF